MSAKDQEELKLQKQYKAAYYALGVERRQEGIPKILSKDVATVGVKGRVQSDHEKFWSLRRDVNWVEKPLRKSYNRKTRKVEVRALVTDILLQLAPSSTFDPHVVMEGERQAEKVASAALAGVALSSTANAGASGATESKASQIVAENKLRIQEDAQIAEVTRIRNSKDCLHSLVGHISSQRGREILLVEILKQAMTEPRDVVEVFDVLWAIENMTLSDVDAPPPRAQSDILPTVRDSSLTYDSVKNVQTLLKEARKLRSREKEIIRFQLIEMSDRLPPLTKYGFGFKLDAWQKRTVAFIDSGRSVIICAPTSSGKTVLSTYVARLASTGIDDPDKTTSGRDGKGRGSVSNVPLSKGPGAPGAGAAASASLGEADEAGGDIPRDWEDADDEEGEAFETGVCDEDDNDAEEDAEIHGVASNVDNMTIERSLGDASDLRAIATADRIHRRQFRHIFRDNTQRVLFVVPSEPLVWQVAAYFTALLRDKGDAETKVAIVTNQMSYYPASKIDVMPRIVVGTPFALESALTKQRGLVGALETAGKAQGDVLPGGFEHFDWAIYDEVHALDGLEGDALQRLIRAMSCKFLALSATVGNAEELRDWFERVKGDQILGVEVVTVLPEETYLYGSATASSGHGNCALPPPAPTASKKKAKGGQQDTPVTVEVLELGDDIGKNIVVEALFSKSTVEDLKTKIWRALTPAKRDYDPAMLCLRLKSISSDSGNASVVLSDAAATLGSLAPSGKLTVELLSHAARVTRTLDGVTTALSHVSPLCSLLALKERIATAWPIFPAEGLQLFLLKEPSSAFPPPPIFTLKNAVTKGDMELVLELTNTASFNGVEKLVRGTLLALSNSKDCSDDGLEVVTIYSATANTGGISVKVTGCVKAHAAGVTLGMIVVAEELPDDKKLLKDYGLFTPADYTPPLFQVRSLVNMVSHQVRFINLQRFVWKNAKLLPVNPLAAIETVQSLKDGVLNSSSLSFTSRDSFRLWQEIERMFPASVSGKFDPANFFPAETRITLQHTKDYEDMVKKNLRVLAVEFPVETQELLHSFHLDEIDKEADICDVALALKAENMLPGLFFHLNAFEAIKLFQQLLAGLEWRQKCDHPTYYMDLIAEKELQASGAKKVEKSTGGNAKELEELMRSGDIDAGAQSVAVDTSEPHPNYRYSKGITMTAAEFVDLSDDMERFDGGFPKRDPATMRDYRGQNADILSHALMRGLKRGIGLYINEVSTPAYRRAVQRLASQGKLAVVVSDDSLAFGVNMPFRTCVFCGEMDGELTPLMAQQMCGRAGRRGLDTQGNLVYVGSRASFIRELMMGQVARITGEAYKPKYVSQFLQGILSPRHVGWGRVETLGGRSLDEHVNAVSISTSENFGLDFSREAMKELGFIMFDDETRTWVPTYNYEALSMIWDQREHQQESVALGRMLPHLVAEMKAKQKELTLSSSVLNQGSFSKKDKNARSAIIVPFFFSMILQIVDRHEYNPATSAGLPSLQEHSSFGPDRAQDRDLFFRWAAALKADQAEIPEYLSYLRLPAPTDVDKADTGKDYDGTPLDSLLFQCIIDRKFMNGLSNAQRQVLKARIWKVGNTLKLMLNALWPNNEFYEIIGGAVNTCFKHLLYLTYELVHFQINFDDVSSASREVRAEKQAGLSVRRPKQAKPMVAKDTADDANATISRNVSTPVPFAVAFGRVVARMREWRSSATAGASVLTAASFNDQLARLCGVFKCLKMQTDLPLLRLALSVPPTESLVPGPFKDAEAATATAFCSPALQSPQHLIGLLVWVCLRVFPPACINKFPLYIKNLIEYDEGNKVLLTGADVLAWVAQSAEESVSLLPSGAAADVSEADVIKLKSSAGMKACLQWIEQPEEDDEDDDED